MTGCTSKSKERVKTTSVLGKVYNSTNKEDNLDNVNGNSTAAVLAGKQTNDMDVPDISSPSLIPLIFLPGSNGIHDNTKEWLTSLSDRYDVHMGQLTIKDNGKPSSMWNTNKPFSPVNLEKVTGLIDSNIVTGAPWVLVSDGYGCRVAAEVLKSSANYLADIGLPSHVIFINLPLYGSIDKSRKSVVHARRDRFQECMPLGLQSVLLLSSGNDISIFKNAPKAGPSGKDLLESASSTWACSDSVQVYMTRKCSQGAFYDSSTDNETAKVECYQMVDIFLASSTASSKSRSDVNDGIVNMNPSVDAPQEMICSAEETKECYRDIEMCDSSNEHLIVPSTDDMQSSDHLTVPSTDDMQSSDHLTVPSTGDMQSSDHLTVPSTDDMQSSDHLTVPSTGDMKAKAQIPSAVDVDHEVNNDEISHILFRGISSFANDAFSRDSSISSSPSNNMIVDEEPFSSVITDESKSDAPDSANEKDKTRAEITSTPTINEDVTSFEEEGPCEMRIEEPTTLDQLVTATVIETQVRSVLEPNECVPIKITPHRGNENGTAIHSSSLPYYNSTDNGSDADLPDGHTRKYEILESGFSPARIPPKSVTFARLSTAISSSETEAAASTDGNDDDKSKMAPNTEHEISTLSFRDHGTYNKEKQYESM